MYLRQGWEFAHSLTAHSLICSDRSNQQMSDCERFAQIAQDKWATVSESLRLLMSKERFAQVAHEKLVTEWFAEKISLKSYFWHIFVHFVI